ncbi:MAG: ribonuclease Y [Victivallales bacterium]|nr:ribonuclease Y [Victivallales bacterium]
MHLRLVQLLGKEKVSEEMLGDFISLIGLPPLAELNATESYILVGIVLVLVTMAIWLIVTRKVQQENDKNLLKQANEEAELIRQKAKLEAENIVKDSKIKAKEELIRLRDQFEKDSAERRKELQKLENRLNSKEETLDKRQDQMDAKSAEIDAKERDIKGRLEGIKNKEAAISEKLERQIEELERIAGLTKDEAKEQMLEKLEETLENERGVLIRRYQEENRQKLIEDGQKIMINAMQRYAGDCAYERTTYTIPLPNEEMKGRIIGREGRNIRTIEAATGVNVLIDDTPEAVVISCFDPVRREIARLTMERLVSDGRIHPARVEEIFAKMKKDVENEIQKAGQEAVQQLGITRLRPNLVTLIGRLKYRYSFSQNVLMHSIEVASMMGAIAAQVGLDERKARRAGLLHDIGKAVDHEVEGTHAMIGADLLKRAGEDDEIVNAVAAHHEEVEKTSLMAILVQICDTLSASRPGARSETTELYIKRLEQLETIGNSFDGVENCYAIQAGRELRVIVQPEKITEDKAIVLAHDMAERIEKEMRYPGQVRVSVIRETRAVEYAK